MTWLLLYYRSSSSSSTTLYCWHTWPSSIKQNRTRKGWKSYQRYYLTIYGINAFRRSIVRHADTYADRGNMSFWVSQNSKKLVATTLHFGERFTSTNDTTGRCRHNSPPAAKWLHVILAKEQDNSSGSRKWKFHHSSKLIFFFSTSARQTRGW